MHINLKTAKGLSAIFASAAIALGHSPARADEISDFIHGEVISGTRGIGIGEIHFSATLPEKVGAAFQQFKEDGGTTVYSEYVPDSEQAMLDAALSGDEDAQRDLRAIFEYGWGQRGHETAQSRYDLLFKAHRRGLRVLGIDTPMASEEKLPHMTPSGLNRRNRLLIADPHMTDVIRKHDDAKPFLFLVGEDHTYAAGHAADSGGDEYLKKSDLGGVDARLKAAGIPVVTLDLSDQTGSEDIRQSDTVSSDFSVTLPPEGRGTDLNAGLQARGMVINATKIFSAVSLEEKGEARIKGMLAVQSLGKLKRALDECQSEKVIEEKVRDVVSQGTSFTNAIPNQKYRDYVNYGLRIAEIVAFPSVVAENKNLCQPGARAFWRGPASFQ